MTGSKSKTTQQQNWLTTAINPKNHLHTDCETKALHVYKVQDCFWFHIHQLVYISDAKQNKKKKRVQNICFNQYSTERFDSEVSLRKKKRRKKYDRESVNWHNKRLIKAPWLAVHNKAKYKSFFFLYKL